MTKQIYKGVAHDLGKRPLEEHEIKLMERILRDTGGRVRIPVVGFGEMKPKDAEGLKGMIDCLRELEVRGYVEAEVDDARSEIRVTLLEPALILLEARGCLREPRD